MRKPAPPRDLPPPLELECLQSLWRLGEGNVRVVREDLANAGRPLAYTTVMTLLDRLARRGAVSRTKRGRCFFYLPQLNRDQALSYALEEMARTFFAGSRAGLQSYIAGDGTALVVGEGAAEEDLDITLL
ncbi:MAG: BlaI/MecI/CopY family transcriptional regulator [Acidobacteriia bacterium]|nr:BlaI/MecI/CopY family transcriptional regulator [Terriglobia bacterium]